MLSKNVFPCLAMGILAVKVNYFGVTIFAPLFLGETSCLSVPFTSQGGDAFKPMVICWYANLKRSYHACLKRYLQLPTRNVQRSTYSAKVDWNVCCKWFGYWNCNLDLEKHRSRKYFHSDFAQVTHKSPMEDKKGTRHIAGNASVGTWNLSSLDFFGKCFTSKQVSSLATWRDNFKAEGCHSLQCKKNIYPLIVWCDPP